MDNKEKNHHTNNHHDTPPKISVCNILRSFFLCLVFGEKFSFSEIDRKHINNK